jgi:hypothetical protein
VKSATRDLVHRLANELEPLARRRPPRCNYAMAPYIPRCPDPRCQAWFDEVIAWHTERFGPRHATVSVMAAWTLSERRNLPLEVRHRGRHPMRPVTLAMDIEPAKDWITAELAVHNSASRADLHELVDRLWPEIERLRQLSKVEPRPRRLGALDRPARTTLWRFRRHEGATLAAIADEWENLTREWAAHPKGSVPPGRLEYPAHREWLQRGVDAGVETVSELTTISRAIAKFDRLSAAGNTSLVSPS